LRRVKHGHETEPGANAEYELPLAGFTGTPEEKDRQWFEQCYRGDSQRQLTWECSRRFPISTPR
jgi:hypothetical protein